MLNDIRPAPHSTVVVVGAGAVGLAAIMAVGINPLNLSKVIAVDIVPERLELAKKYGATHVINGKEKPDLAQALKDLTDGEGVDGAIDTTGRPQILEALLDACAKRGVVVSVGVGDVRIVPQFHSRRCYTLLSSFLIPTSFHPLSRKGEPAISASGDTQGSY